MKGLVIWLRRKTGYNESILNEIGREIQQRGGRVEVFSTKSARDLGLKDDEKARAAACALIAKHGVIVVASGVDSPEITSDDDLEVRVIDEYDLRDGVPHSGFMREFELAGLIPPPKLDIHPDEEREILERLRRLGYLD